MNPHYLLLMLENDGIFLAGEGEVGPAPGGGSVKWCDPYGLYALYLYQ